MNDFEKNEQLVKVPTVQDAERILFAVLGKNARNIKRFPTGLANYVYDVVTDDNQNLVVRLTRPDLSFFFQGATFWYSALKQKQVPLPDLYFFDTTGTAYGFPVMIMERLPGKDLGEVYSELTFNQKRVIADQIITIQRSVATMPMGRGYGYARSNNDSSLKQSWLEVLEASLERSTTRIRAAGVVDATIVERVKTAMHSHTKYFASVKPNCFLDDTTTKNVIINEGKLSGIVDVDMVAFGDSLFTLALTAVALLSGGFDTDYTDFWEEQLNLNSEQKRALALYTALFGVDFLSEEGHAFNKEKPETVNRARVQRLENIVAANLASI